VAQNLGKNPKKEVKEQLAPRSGKGKGGAEKRTYKEDPS